MPAWAGEFKGGQKRARLAETRQRSAALPPGTPNPAWTPDLRPPDPGVQTQPEPRGACPPGRGQAGSGGVLAAESSALRKSNAFVPPVGPAPTLHAPAESSSETSKGYRSEACPGGPQVQGSAPPPTWTDVKCLQMTVSQSQRH